MPAYHVEAYGANSGKYPRDYESLLLQINSLETQIQEQTKLSKEQIDSLMEDRRTHMEEYETQRLKDSNMIKGLKEKLLKTSSLLHESTKDFSVGTTFGDETHEFELKTYKKQLVAEEKSRLEMATLNAELSSKLRLLEEELREDKRQIEMLNTRLTSTRSRSYETRDVHTESEVATRSRACSNTDLSSLNEQIDLKINNSAMACVGDSTKHRKGS